jgi:hypothetical protein
MNQYLKTGLIGGPLAAGAQFLGNQPGVKNFFMGTPQNQQQVPRFSPGVMGGIENLFSQGMQNMNPNAIEGRARQQFQTQTMPSIAERFTSMGGAGGQRSSAFAPAAMGAGADLESQLAALRSQLGMQQTQMGLTPAFDTLNNPAHAGVLEQSIPGLLQLLMSLAMGGGF